MKYAWLFLFLYVLSLRAQTWDNCTRSTQFAEWGEASNWREGRIPNAPGATVLMDTHGTSKYVWVREPITLGQLRTEGTNCPPAAFLGAQAGSFTMDTGTERAGTIESLREGTDLVDLPIFFRHGLRIQIGVESDARTTPRTSLFFDEKASFMPLGEDALAELTFCVHSRVQPWAQSSILAQRRQNVIRGFLEDGESGTTLALRKEGRGTLALTSADNGYSGGTTVCEGTLCAVNGPNLEPPFLSLGTGPVTWNSIAKSEVALLSSRSGIWGPDDGYAFHLPRGGTLSFGSAGAWNDIHPERDHILCHQIGSLSTGGKLVTLRERSPSQLRIAREMRLTGKSVTLHVVRSIPHPWNIPTVDIAGPLREESGLQCALRKTGNGMLALKAPGEWAGHLEVVEGILSLGSGTELGTSSLRVREEAVLCLRAPHFQPSAAVQQDPGSVELWLDDEARLGPATPAYCMPPGVRLAIAGDLLDLEAHTLTLQGGSLSAWRDPTRDDPLTHILGPGLTLHTTTNLCLGSIPPKTVFRPRSPFEAKLFARHPLEIRGDIFEDAPLCALIKVGYDAAILRGHCHTSGGTQIRAGSLAVRGNGSLGTGPLLIAWEGPLSGGKPLGEARLTLSSPASLPEDTPISIGTGGILELAFDGAIVTPSLHIGNRSFGPGIYTQDDFPCIQGPGQIIVIPL